MFGLDDLVEGFVGGSILGAGIVAGATAALVGGRRSRPVAKQAIKGYLAVTQRLRESIAETGEQLQDLYAEAKHEYRSQLSSAPTDPSAETSAPRRARTAADQPA